ncbi:hypothetical protein D3C81_150570 [compost metagenome]
MVKTHVLHLPGLDNFRSLAGMRTLCGRRIAGHSLLRSDQLHRLSVASWQVLSQWLAGCGFATGSSDYRGGLASGPRHRRDAGRESGGGGRAAHDAGGVPEVARTAGAAYADAVQPIYGARALDTDSLRCRQGPHGCGSSAFAACAWGRTWTDHGGLPALGAAVLPAGYPAPAGHAHCY